MRFVAILVLTIVFPPLWPGEAFCRAADDYSTSHTTPLAPQQPNDYDLLPREVELSRFKKQALQSVSVAGGGVFEFDQRDLNSSFLDLAIGTGIPMGSFDNILGVTPRFRVDWIDASPTIEIPAQLYEFELQFFYRCPIRDRLSALAIVSPSIRSDLSTSDKAFRLPCFRQSFGR